MTISHLDLTQDPTELTKALVDIPSPSHHEEAIADAIEQALKPLEAAGVELARFGNTVCARTNRGLASRIVLAGHVDTVPIADNVPHHMEGNIMFGCGTVDMKSGLAVYLHTFAQLAAAENLQHDLTLIAYEGEEVSTEFNGLGHLQRDNPQWLQGDLALLGEPSGAMIEAGCQGTIRLRVTAHGTRAHSARAWLGSNAAHTLAPVMTKIAEYSPRNVTIDGCTYREGLNIVHLEAGVATNTLPDVAWMFVNFRFAPDRSSDEAMAHMLEVLGLSTDQQLPADATLDEAGISYEVDDVASAALPGLGQPAAAALIDAVGGNVRAKYGWTDVARFSEMGTPAVNFGPGDPGFAHKRDEQCPVDQITSVAEALQTYLTSK
ncbi:succinyl-diaminopimelate desuccinylase [Corynebacterium casei]|uniref:Succinyl-diaminopimelate desuccinylase n=1 Tax=Corynebacterium casei LMG S-19264 TaxID=1285583 RepID=A0ABN4CF88_9CORY|nr:succinyl-diaminopimelate desuccinylase [Corynebacterium casei]AHI20373.1 succinyl-diaminopimelate desuccinylase [Corynebacterium casei LMG S-19264]